jgi:hypothetical protein
MLSVLAAEAQEPVTAEFRINTHTTNRQVFPRVASDAAGNFVVVWASFLQDGSSEGVFARRFLPSGAPADGAEFRVNAHTTGQQWLPAVAMDATGRFVVAWQSTSQSGDAEDGIFARLYEANGSPGPELHVNSHTTGNQGFPAVAMAPDGRFVVVWSGAAPGSADLEARGQLYDAAGNPSGGEFQVNSYTTGLQRFPSVGMDAAGRFVIAWMDNYDIAGRRFDASGAPLAPQFTINTFTTGTQSMRDLAVNADGSFLVAWRNGAAFPDGGSTRARRYDPLGQPQGAEFTMNSFTTGDQEDAVLAVTEGGDFIAAWTDQSREGDSRGVFGRVFDPSAAPHGNDFHVNTYITGDQSVPDVAAVGPRHFVVTWSSYGQDGSDRGIYARLFDTDLIFRDGFESGDMTAWSSNQTDGGDLDVTGPAALKTTSAGLLATVDDTAGLFVQDDSPRDEERYQARFYFDTRTFDPGETLNRRRTRLFIAFEEAPTRRVVAIVLRRLNGDYSLMGRARLDDNSQHDTGFKPITPGAHFVEVHWRRASGPDANDGVLEMWIDGIFAHTFWNLDNSLSAIDFVRLGALSVKAGANGTLALDEFESRRYDFIGP